jgi:hypothetical protein
MDHIVPVLSLANIALDHFNYRKHSFATDLTPKHATLFSAAPERPHW